MQVRYPCRVPGGLMSEVPLSAAPELNYAGEDGRGVERESKECRKSSAL